MKPGAGDDPFAENSSETVDTPPESEASDNASSKKERTDSESGSTAVISPSDQAQKQALPYKYRRDSVKQGRNQQPVFLQSETEDLIEETIGRIEDRFDEKVYKTDVVEAVLVAGGEGTTPEEVLQRWGYGMKNR
ncbi:hypothetical protein ACOZ4L_16825 (plasmid) [Haloplanus ruber]|uniref:Uncharacterized protein n=1 Tax=Haloplanus ruber TaxID=869892 RepID=A0ABD6D341_9EURY|nr:hypothetical protein [Haloplanus ruber]